MANDLISDDWVTFTPSQPTSNDGMLAYVGQTLLASPLMTARGHNPRPTNIFIVIVAPSHSRSLTRPKGNRIERAPLRNGFKLTSAPPIKSNGCRFKLEWFNDYFRCWRLNRVSKQWKASEILFEQKKKRKKKTSEKGSIRWQIWFDWNQRDEFEPSWAEPVKRPGRSAALPNEINRVKAKVAPARSNTKIFFVYKQNYMNQKK